MKILRGPRQRVLDFDFSPDGQLLVASYNDSTVRVWDTFSGEGRILIEGEKSLFSAFFRVTFTQDGRHILARSSALGLQVWSVAESKHVATLVAGGSAIYGGGIAVAPMGHRVVVHEWIPHPFGNRLHLWDANTWKASLLYQTTENYSFSALAFDPTGTRLDTSIGVFAVPGGERLTNSHTWGDRARWSPDGKWQAWAGSGPDVWVYNSDDGNDLRYLTLERKYVQGFSFSPDSAFLVVVSNEEIVRVWETTTWTERDGFAWRIGKLKGVAFAPDGQRAACASERGAILIWDWDL